METVKLSDAESGAEAEILVSLGFNCYRLRCIRDGQPYEVLWADDDFAQGTGRPSGSGIPILFPFAGRLSGTTFTWEGKAYEIPEGDGRGNAIHGFVHRRPWRVKQASSSRVVAEFHAERDDPSLLDQWPGDFLITACYELVGNALHAGYEICNTGDGVLPWSLGLHPYFRVPLGGDKADACRVVMPFEKQWELRDMLPTGKVLPVTDAAAYARGLAFFDMQFDDVFAGVRHDEHGCEASITDPTSGRTTHLNFDTMFPYCVVYNPPHRQAVCIEPYTSAPAAIQLQPRGVEAGLKLLDPGEAAVASMAISFS